MNGCWYCLHWNIQWRTILYQSMTITSTSKSIIKAFAIRQLTTIDTLSLLRIIAGSEKKIQIKSSNGMTHEPWHNLCTLVVQNFVKSKQWFVLVDDFVYVLYHRNDKNSLDSNDKNWHQMVRCIDQNYFVPNRFVAIPNCNVDYLFVLVLKKSNMIHSINGLVNRVSVCVI